jgi:hypothetical protein
MNEQTTNEAERLIADLDKPSLRALSYVLRHPNTWPEGFIWNYDNCESCAMGLAHELWDVSETENKNAASIMSRTFGISYEEADSIFMGQVRGKPAPWREYGPKWWRSTVPRGDVSPEMVADAIDSYLASEEQHDAPARN